MSKFVIKLFTSFWFTNLLYSQSTIFLDKASYKPISDLHVIDNEKNVFTTNKMGVTKLVHANYPLKTSHVSFLPKIISKFKDSIFLEAKNNHLEEVVIKYKKIKPLTLKPKATFSNLNPRNYGKLGRSIYEKKGVRIPVSKKLLIKSIRIQTANVAVWQGKTEEQIDTEYAPIKLNISYLDENIGIPTKNYLFENDTIISKTKNAKCIEFKINSIFEKDIAIIFSPLANDEYAKLNFKYSPHMTIIGVGDNNEFTPFTYDDHSGLWIRDNYLLSRNQTYRIEIDYMVIDE
jgi:hypothetical protein